MKRMILTICVTALAATAALGQSEAQKARLAGEIRKVLEEQAAAWNRGDIDGFMAGYWRSEKMTFVSGSTVTRGWQPALDRYKRSYSTREKMGTLRFSDLEIEVLSKDSAVVLGTWALERAPDNPSGKFTLILRKFPEGWRVVHDHTC